MIADDQTLAAMAKLQHDKDFQRVVAYLDACRNEQETNCVREMDEVLMRRAQGAAQQIGSIVLLINNARFLLEQRKADAEARPQRESYI